MNARLIISLAILGTAYAVSTVDLSPPNEPAQLVTPAPVAVGEAAAGVLEQGDVSSDVSIAPQAVVVAAQQSPAAGGFCTTGNCGPAQARRVYQVQRPQRRGLFGGLFRGRR